MKSQNKLNSENRVESLYNELEEAKAALEKAKDREKEVKEKIKSLYANSIESEYSQKGNRFGTINIEDSGFKVSFVTNKKIYWDQDGLASLLKEGAPVEIEYSVKENVFKELNDAGKAAFMPYRTVELGSVTIKIERIK